MTICTNCGANNPGENRFCSGCGSKLEMGAAPPLEQQPQQQTGYQQPAQPQEVERIGAYNPNADYSYRPMQQPPVMNYDPNYGQPQQPYGYQQPMQQQPYGYQQPPVVMPPYGYQQPMQQQPYGYQQPPYGYQQPPYGYQQPHAAKPGSRWSGVVLSLITLLIAVATLFVIPTDFSSFDLGKSLFGLGSSTDGVVILAFVILALIFAIISILIPLFSIVTGVSILGIIALIMLGNTFTITIGVAVVFALLSLIVIMLGLVANLCMNKYVRYYMPKANMYQCCIFAWKGVPKQPAQPQQPMQQQQQPPQY